MNIDPSKLDYYRELRDKLLEAMISGARVVKMKDREIEYATFSDMSRALRFANNILGESTDEAKITNIQMNFSRRG